MRPERRKRIGAEEERRKGGLHKSGCTAALTLIYISRNTAERRGGGGLVLWDAVRYQQLPWERKGEGRRKGGRRWGRREG